MPALHIGFSILLGITAEASLAARQGIAIPIPEEQRGEKMSPDGSRQEWINSFAIDSVFQLSTNLGAVVFKAYHRWTSVAADGERIESRGDGTFEQSTQDSQNTFTRVFDLRSGTALAALPKEISPVAFDEKTQSLVGLSFTVSPDDAKSLRLSRHLYRLSDLEQAASRREPQAFATQITELGRPYLCLLADPGAALVFQDKERRLIQLQLATGQAQVLQSLPDDIDLGSCHRDQRGILNLPHGSEGPRVEILHLSSEGIDTRAFATDLNQDTLIVGRRFFVATASLEDKIVFERRSLNFSSSPFDLAAQRFWISSQKGYLFPRIAAFGPSPYLKISAWSKRGQGQESFHSVLNGERVSPLLNRSTHLQITDTDPSAKIFLVRDSLGQHRLLKAETLLTLPAEEQWRARVSEIGQSLIAYLLVAEHLDAFRDELLAHFKGRYLVSQQQKDQVAQALHSLDAESFSTRRKALAYLSELRDQPAFLHLRNLWRQQKASLSVEQLTSLDYLLSENPPDLGFELTGLFLLAQAEEEQTEIIEEILQIDGLDPTVRQVAESFLRPADHEPW